MEDPHVDGLGRSRHESFVSSGENASIQRIWPVTH
jgi:hypothetical protein